MATRKRAVRGMSEGAAKYVPKTTDRPVKPAQTAKLFANGRSQAVRLPREFRFEGKEVYVRREGRSVVLTPKEEPKENPWKDFFDALDMFDPRFPLERHQPTDQQVRKSFEIFQPPKRKRALSR